MGMVEHSVPVTTDVGVLGFWRDTIIVDRVVWVGAAMSVYCAINAGHIDGYRGARSDLQARIAFDGVVSMFHAVLDTYQAIPDGAFTKTSEMTSNLELIEGSRYARDLPVRPDWVLVMHYRLWTYDDVFDVLARSVTLEELPIPVVEGSA